MLRLPRATLYQGCGHEFAQPGLFEAIACLQLKANRRTMEQFHCILEFNGQVDVLASNLSETGNERNAAATLAYRFELREVAKEMTMGIRPKAPRNLLLSDSLAFHRVALPRKERYRSMLKRPGKLMLPLRG